MFKFLLYAILLIISSILWLASFILATCGFAIGIAGFSSIDIQSTLGYIAISLVFFGSSYGCQLLAKFLDPSYLYYEEDY